MTTSPRYYAVIATLMGILVARCDEPASESAAPATVHASEVAYDRSTSAVEAVNVQGALDELAATSASLQESLATLEVPSPKPEDLSPTVEAQAEQIASLEQDLAELKSIVNEQKSTIDEQQSSLVELEQVVQTLTAEDIGYDDSGTALGTKTVQGAIAATTEGYHALKQQCEAGDAEMSESIAALDKVLSDVQEQLDAPMGPRPCPVDMEAINETYCIEPAQEPEDILDNAVATCADRDRRLCTAVELGIGCVKLGELGDFGKGVYEWTDDVLGITLGPGDVPFASMAAVGGSACFGAIEAKQAPLTNHPFRCCITR